MISRIQWLNSAGTAFPNLCLAFHHLKLPFHNLKVSLHFFCQHNKVFIICDKLRVRSFQNGAVQLFVHPTAYVKSWLAASRHAATDMGNAKKDVRAGPGQVAIWKIHAVYKMWISL